MEDQRCGKALNNGYVRLARPWGYIVTGLERSQRLIPGESFEEKHERPSRRAVLV